MRRLVWGFAGRTYHIVGNLVHWLIWTILVEGDRQFQIGPILFDKEFYSFPYTCIPGRVAQLGTCLATDASLTADPGVASSIRARSHNFVKLIMK